MTSRRKPQPADPTKPNDAFSLVSAAVGGGRSVPVWDDGYGRLWAVWGSLGNFGMVLGFVRAETWEEAWECAVDEIFPDPCESDIAEYEERASKAGDDGEELPEGWHYRGSGNPANGDEFPGILSTIYAETSLDISNPLEPASARSLDAMEAELKYEL